MTSELNQATGSHSLVSSNMALLLSGALVLLVVSWIIMQTTIDSHWYHTAGLLQLAALAGLLLRGLRRKIYFGGDLSLHQSLSFEVVIQSLQAVSPMLLRRAFEAEFMAREMTLSAERTGAWIRSRKVAIPFIILMPCVALMLMLGLHWQAGALALLAAVALLHSLRAMRRASSSSETAVVPRHLRSTLAGVCIWGVEATLFVYATQSVLPHDQALILYLLFTGIMEFSFVPLALGIAESSALVGLWYGNAPTALACVALFHAARLLPLLPLGATYLARYKLRFLDLLDGNLISRLVQTRRPEQGWAYQPGDDPLAPRLSVIIPAYNEAERLPAYLSEVRSGLDQRGINAEILVVDDGSQDGTADYVRSVASQDARVRLLAQPRNQGKGRAVQRGMLEASGHYLLFADADGATPFREVEQLLAAAETGREIIIGSRRVASNAATRERLGLRALMGQTFYSFVNFFAVPGINDTQCGFKLFRRDCARVLFDGLNESGWAFDVEVLYRAQLTGYGISEVAVNWHEVDGSKVSPVQDAIRMFMAVFRIRRHNAGFLRPPAFVDTGHRGYASPLSQPERI
ncbi:MAG: glycosyltransferase family 2 protein [Gammaproteobacteria bacterium]|nr:glycosyltransferase family 2 protein [Gammaproteobacteria bacterium]